LPLDVAFDGRNIWVANNGDNNVSVIAARKAWMQSLCKATVQTHRAYPVAAINGGTYKHRCCDGFAVPFSRIPHLRCTNGIAVFGFGFSAY
jgi:hypothetical protein